MTDEKSKKCIDLTKLVKGLVIPVKKSPDPIKPALIQLDQLPETKIIPKKPKIVPAKIKTNSIPKINFDPYNDPTRIPRKRQDESYKIIDQFWNPDFTESGLLVMLYTAYGKTNVALYLTQKIKNMGKITIVLVPLKALAEDHFPKFNKHFNTVICTSDHESDDEKQKIFDPETEVIIMTFEKYSKYVKIPSLRKKFFANDRIGALVVDECHLIVDAERGANLEAFDILLTQEYQPEVKLLMLSATIGNPERIAENYNLRLVKCEDPSERPVPLVIETHQMRKLYGTKQKTEMAEANAFALIDSYLHKFGKEKLPNFLFFCTTRDLTTKLCTSINSHYAPIGIKAMVHNGGMNYEDRHKTEEDFRNQNVKIVVCTTTLSMGIDMPCDICALMGETFWNWLRSEERLIDPNSVKQIMGRSGRGNGTLQKGYAHIYYQQPNRDYMEYYVDHQLDVVSRVLPIDIVGKMGNLFELPLDFSGAVPNKLPNVLLGWIVSGTTDIPSLKRLYQRLLRPINWEMFDTTYKWLQDNGFIDQQGFHTDIGFKTTLYGIEPATALHFMKLKECLDNIDEISYPNLFALLIACDQYCSQIAIREDSEDDGTALSNATRFLNADQLNKIVGDNQYFQDQLETFMDQIRKAFSMTYNRHIADEYKLPSIRMSNNDVNTLRNNAKMLIHSGHQIIEKTWKWHSKLDLLNKGLQMEVDRKPYPIFDESLLEIMQIKGMGIKKTNTVIAIGARNLSDLAKLDPMMVEKRSGELALENKERYFKISAKIFTEIRERAKELLQTPQPTLDSFE